jgi:glycosyltransferase involved in cell wall biosynthesis
MADKTLSVLMANYNYGHYISEALEAILSQSFKPKEIIIIDDGSTDNSLSVINEFAENNPNIRVLRNEKNMGGLYSINRCLEVATGDYIYSAAADDKVLPGFFEKSMGLLSRYPAAGLSCSDITVFDGRRYIDNRMFLSLEARYFSPKEIFKIFRRDEFTPFLPHSVIVKRASLSRAGGYMSILKWSCDAFAHSVISFRDGICYLPEVLTMMRSHPGQQGISRAKKSHLEREVIRNIIDTAKRPEYADVLPMLERTVPFSSFPWEVLMVAVGRRDYWGFLSFKLLRFALFDKLIRRFLLRILPMSLCRRMVSASKRIKQIFLQR